MVKGRSGSSADFFFGALCGSRLRVRCRRRVARPNNGVAFTVAFPSPPLLSCSRLIRRLGHHEAFGFPTRRRDALLRCGRLKLYRTSARTWKPRVQEAAVEPVSVIGMVMQCNRRLRALCTCLRQDLTDLIVVKLRSCTYDRKYEGRGLPRFQV